ncbi:hypothetical protein [Microbacterium sp. Leaf151]|nr:hypothetical protein [Microbacterium sp. Leaf151]
MTDDALPADTIDQIRARRGQREQTDIDRLRAERRDRREPNDRKDTE